jgi:phosphate/sulfate permease
MGMLTLVLLLGGFIPSFEVPFWVMLACAAAITLGISPAAGASCARSASRSTACARFTP